MVKSFNFDLIFLRRISTLLIEINSYGNNFMLLSFLLLLAMLNEIAIYNVGMITGSYYKVLGDKDRHQFVLQTIQAISLIIILALIKSCKEYVASTLYIEWRQMLTKKMHSLYFTDLSFYRFNVIETETDNLDQRMTQDVEKWCQHLSLVLPDLIVSPFTIAFYTYTSFATIGYFGPVGCVVYFIISSLINKCLISAVVNLVYAQEKCEGDFRFQHLRVRNNAESIAFMNGHHFEYDKSEHIFSKLIRVQEKLILREFFLKSSVYLFDYFGSIVSFVVISFPLFAGSYDSLSATDLSELISQNAFVTIYLINCFTKLIDTSTQFTIIAGTTHRIAEVIQLLSLKPLRIETSGSTYSAIERTNNFSQSKSETQIYIKLTNVGIKVPKTDKRLISKLSLKISQGSNLLISGPSGTCKTSILRVLKGIWPETSGHVDRYLSMEDTNVVLFLPQKPVMTTGSLLEQITYPQRYENYKYQSEDATKEQIINYMRFLDLNQILDRINYEIEKDMGLIWSDCLSPGEMQRIGFVRLFYHRPVLAVLDEATSAVSVQMEKKIYNECKRLKITLISCGHRESLEQYHSQALRVYKSEDIDDHVVNKCILQNL